MAAAAILPSVASGHLKTLYETGDWSDLTLETATRSFKVHKAILCPASPFFDAVCRNGSEESNAGIIYLTESELVIDAALRHIYQQPIDWLRYHAEDLRDMVEKGCSALVIEFGSMVLSDTTPSDDGLSINAVWSRLSNILDLESAACKFDLPTLGTICCASFATLYPSGRLDIERLVDIGRLVFGMNNASEPLAIVAAHGTFLRYNEILDDPRAWAILHENEDYAKAVGKLLVREAFRGRQ